MVAPEGHSRAFPSNGKDQETFFTLTAGQGAGDRRGFDSSCSKQVWGGNVRNETDGEDRSWLMESFTIRPYKPLVSLEKQSKQVWLVSHSQGQKKRAGSGGSGHTILCTVEVRRARAGR